jgi:hypothetical protein
MPFAQFLDRRSTLGVAYFLIALFQGVCPETLPREAAAQEVHEHVPDGFQVVSSALLATEVSVDTHVSEQQKTEASRIHK